MKKKSYKPSTSQKRKDKKLPSPEEVYRYINSLEYLPSLSEVMETFNLGPKHKKEIKKITEKRNSEGSHKKSSSSYAATKDSKSENLKLPKMLKVVVEKKERRHIIARGLGPVFSAFEFHINLPNKVHISPHQKILILRQNLIKKNSYKGKFIKVLDQENLNTEKLIGIVEKSGRKMLLSPVTRQLSGKYYIDHSSIKLNPGDLVRGTILKRFGRSGGSVSVEEKLESSSNPKLMSLIEVYQSDISCTFSPRAIKEAQKAHIPPLKNREDLRHLELVTIDQEDAKDFDDAVWAEKSSNGWHIIVAIADVAYYVPVGGSLDEEAYERGNSSYFPDFVTPMLPEVLSNDLCSLKPNEDRGSLVVHMWIDYEGNLIKHHFSRALIKSHHRLTYKLVQEVYRKPEKNPGLWKILAPLFSAYECLKKNRFSRGALELELDERKVIFGEKGEIKSISSQERFESHKLIEEMMILANVCAAKTLLETKIPSIFRTHEKPRHEKVALLLSTLKNLGISTKSESLYDPNFFNNILEKTLNHPTQFLIQDMVLRSQSQASYTSKNIGHFGLGLENYAHFTSPIRRYADLVVHRSLITALSLGEGGWNDLPTEEALDAIGEHISSTERNSKQAERNALNRYIISFMQGKTDKIFQGHISGVHTAGIFVKLDDTGAEGFIPKSKLPFDTYRLLEVRPCLQGRKHNFTLGDSVKVYIEEANAHKNGLIFSLIKNTSK